MLRTLVDNSVLSAAEEIRSQGPHSQILTGEGGAVRQRFIFCTPKNRNFRICLPKKSLLFLAYPKNPLVLFSQPKKIPLLFFVTQKNPGVFHRPKKITFAKISDPKKLLGPIVIKICEWDPWGLGTLSLIIK